MKKFHDQINTRENNWNNTFPSMVDISMNLNETFHLSYDSLFFVTRCFVALVNK